MYILGINSVYSDSSACLLKDGEIIALVEEERFNRIKYGKQARPDNPDELPLAAINFCLTTAGITPHQVDQIGYSFDLRKAQQDQTHELLPESWRGEAGQMFLDKIAGIPQKLMALGFTGEFSYIEHHTAHAASTFYVSPFQEAAVLTVDGIGETNTTAFFKGENHRLHPIQEIQYPNSLGLLWEFFSLFLGFGNQDAAKIMGLAAYGNPKRYREPFAHLVQLADNGRFTMADALLRFDLLEYTATSGYFAKVETLFGLQKRQRSQELEQAYADIAAALQARTDEVSLHMVEQLYATTNSDNLCLAGGVALNCVTNRYVFEKGPFKQLYVPPTPHDGGTALGAAYYIWHQHFGNQQRSFMNSAYLGPAFSDAEIEKVLQAQKLSYQRVDSIEQRVAQLVSEGHIVAFFQGRMEAGPRALGNRTLLADPRNPNMREILNHKVKHREHFRPLAPSVLYEEAQNWFHIEKETVAAEFMLMTYPVKEQYKDKIPAVVHIDGTSRIQAVRQAINPRYHALITAFYQITGVPMMLNTSFNDQEPIVCTPQDALDTFLSTKIDYLAIGNFLVAKEAHHR